MSRRWLLVMLATAGCSEYEPNCLANTSEVTKDEAKVPDCDDTLCLEEIVASNHNLGIPVGDPGCDDPDDLIANQPCQDDYLILRNRHDDREVGLEDYELVRDDISEAVSRLLAAIRVSDLQADPIGWSHVAPVSAVAPGEDVVVFTEVKDGVQPDWMVPHDQGSEWGTIRLRRHSPECEVDHVYYGDLSANPLDFDDDDEDLDEEEEDRVWRRDKRANCPFDLDECWGRACATFDGGLPCTLPQ